MNIHKITTDHSGAFAHQAIEALDLGDTDVHTGQLVGSMVGDTPAVTVFRHDGRTHCTEWGEGAAPDRRSRSTVVDSEEEFTMISQAHLRAVLAQRELDRRTSQ